MRKPVRIGDRFIVIPGRVNLAFICSDNECYMIDSGLDDDQARRVLNIANEEGLTIKALLNTHSHADHIGGNSFFVKRTGLNIYADSREIPFIIEPILEPAVMYGGYPPRDLRNKLFVAKPSYPKDIRGLSVDFEIVDICGHSPGMIGFRTEKVFFVADAYLPKRVIEKHAIPYAYLPKRSLETLEAIIETKGLIYVPSHGEPTERPEEDIMANIEIIKKVKATILEILNNEMTTEDILVKTLNALDVKVEFIGLYHLYSSIIRSYLSWLEEENYIKAVMKGRRLLWQRIKR